MWPLLMPTEMPLFAALMIAIARMDGWVLAGRKEIDRRQGSFCGPGRGRRA